MYYYIRPSWATIRKQLHVSNLCSGPVKWSTPKVPGCMVGHISMCKKEVGIIFFSVDWINKSEMTCKPISCWCSILWHEKYILVHFCHMIQYLFNIKFHSNRAKTISQICLQLCLLLNLFNTKPVSKHQQT